MKRRNLWIAAGAGVLAAAICVTALLRPSVATGAWGLSFPEPGQAPQGPASADTLKQYDAAYMGSTAEKTVYLTFDAGYENGCTGQILDVLKSSGVPAAFFVVSGYIEKNPELVRRMVDEGHIVGNHTVHHYDMSRLSEEAVFRDELSGVEDAFRRLTGKELPKFYRPPRGIYSEENLKAAQKLGYRTVFWSLAYVDWLDDKQPTREQAFQKLLPRMHNGAVVLLHSTSRTNTAILQEFIDKLVGEGYKFGSIDELFA